MDDKDICDDLGESDLDSEDCCSSIQDLIEDAKLTSKAQTLAPDQGPKSMMDNLMQQLDKLTIQLAQYEESSSVPLMTMNQTLICFMCDMNGQGIQECTQMKEFITLGVLEVDVNN